MISNAVKGSSFKGAVAYILHDVGGEKTSIRVEDVELFNFHTQDPDKALKVMQAISSLNTRCKKPVYHLSVSWHEQDKDKLTREDMKAQLQTILKRMGLENHQAIVAFHNDKPHPHAHIIINRIDPQTLKAADLGNDYVRLMQINRELEREYGLTIAPLKERSEEQIKETAFDELTRNKATFSKYDLDHYIKRCGIQDPDEVAKLALSVLAHKDIKIVGIGEHGEARFTSRNYEDREKRMFDAAETLSARQTFKTSSIKQDYNLNVSRLSGEQKEAVREILDGKDLSILIGRAGAGKTTAMKEVVQAYEQSGYQVIGAAPTGAAAKNLGKDTGIKCKTIHSWIGSWDKGSGQPLNDKTVLIVDEAGMLSTKWLDKTLSAAEKAGAKVILVGDPDQLKAVEAGDAFRGLAEKHSYSGIQTIRRQSVGWMREASQNLASGDTKKALDEYVSQDCLKWSDSRAGAREAIVSDYIRDIRQQPDKTRLILAYENQDTRALNDAVRVKLQSNGELQNGKVFKTTEGRKEFAPNDRVVFLKNDYREDMQVANGSMGTVRMVSDGSMAVEMDGSEGRKVVFSMDRYNAIDHGYALTVHKSQGATVDKTYVMASRYFNENTTYVALTRHREDCRLYADSETFDKHGRGEQQAYSKLAETLGRKFRKDLLIDYAENAPTQGNAYEQLLKERAFYKGILHEEPSPFREQFGNKTASNTNQKPSMEDEFKTSEDSLRDFFNGMFGTKSEQDIGQTFNKEASKPSPTKEQTKQPEKVTQKGVNAAWAKAVFHEQKIEALFGQSKRYDDLQKSLEAKRQNWLNGVERLTKATPIQADFLRDQVERNRKAYELAPEHDAIERVPETAKDKPLLREAVKAVEAEIESIDNDPTLFTPEMQEVRQYEKLKREAEYARFFGDSLGYTEAREAIRAYGADLSGRAVEGSTLYQVLEARSYLSELGLDAGRDYGISREISIDMIRNAAKPD
jgi:Ti-type conjugative transfer relaxase TraA